jgi:hypothetical protein
MSRRPTASVDQFIFTFDAPEPATNAADLAGIDRLIAASVGRALRDDNRPRDEVARAMSELLGEEVTRFMLDAYASEARDNAQHLGRALLRADRGHEAARHPRPHPAAHRRRGAGRRGDRDGAGGHLRCQIDRLKDELKQVEQKARPISRAE